MNVTKLLLCPIVTCALIVGVTSAATGDGLTCDMGAYKAAPGLSARVDQQANVIEVDWTGQARDELRAQFAIDRGQPTLRELAIRASGRWITLGRNLVPEYRVTSGVRRMSEQQAAPLRSAGV